MLARLLSRHVDPDPVAIIEGGAGATHAILAEGVDHCFVTGSQETGRQVMAAAAETLTPWRSSSAASRPFSSRTTCSSNAVVAGAFRDALREAGREFTVDRPGGLPIVDERGLRRLERLAAGHGGEVVVLSAVDAASDPRGDAGADGASHGAMPVTLVLEPDPGSPLMQEAIVGPLLPVVTVESFDAVLAFVAAGRIRLSRTRSRRRRATADEPRASRRARSS